MKRIKPPPFNSMVTSSASTTKWFNATINRLSSEGCHHQVLLTYSSMLKSNTPPDSYTFPSLLKACTSLNLLSYGILFHQRVIVNGFSSDAYIASSLINFYAKFGHTCDARRVFDAMPERNVVPWSTIIGCYSHAGNIETAFYMYNQMRLEGVQPSSVTLLGLLSGISELSDLRCLHGCAILYGFESNIVLANSLLHLYGKCGSFRDARDMFESIEERDIVSWNSLVFAAAQVGNLGEVLWLLNRMRKEEMKPDQQTFGCLISAVILQNNLLLGKMVHGHIIRSISALDIHLQTSLIDMYIKCGDIDRACRLFVQTPCKDVVSWTVMISGLVQIGCADKALGIFTDMLISSVMPSTTTIASVLAACAKLGSFHIGTSIHGYVLKRQLTLDTPAQNSLLTMYAKCGCLKQSSIVFERMDEKDVVSWNAIVAAYAQNGYLDQAFILLNNMRTAFQRPDSITVISLLQSCSSTGALHQGKWIHNFVIRNFLGPCIMIGTALIDMYCKCGDLDSAKKCFAGMPQKDLFSWSAIIAGHGTHGQGEAALALFSEFLCTGIEPNPVIFLAVLSACSHNGLVEQGMSLFQSMIKDFGIEPKTEHRACIVDLLCRAGRVEEAYSFYKRMFTEPMVDVLGIILDACRTKGNLGLGDMIAKDILVSKAINAEHYVQLAHCFASMNKWDSVGEAWIQMRSQGLKKLPAWSFIELDGRITTFFADHSSHPQFEDIMSVLESLGRITKKTSNDTETVQVYDII